MDVLCFIFGLFTIMRSPKTLLDLSSLCVIHTFSCFLNIYLRYKGQPWHDNDIMLTHNKVKVLRNSAANVSLAILKIVKMWIWKLGSHIFNQNLQERNYQPNLAYQVFHPQQYAWVRQRAGWQSFCCARPTRSCHHTLWPGPGHPTEPPRCPG